MYNLKWLLHSYLTILYDHNCIGEIRAWVIYWEGGIFSIIWQLWNCNLSYTTTFFFRRIHNLWSRSLLHRLLDFTVPTNVMLVIPPTSQMSPWEDGGAHSSTSHHGSLGQIKLDFRFSSPPAPLKMPRPIVFYLGFLLSKVSIMFT